VIQISGLLDDIVADFIERSIDKAEDNGSGGLILQVNSGRAVVSDERIRELADLIVDAEVPVYAWVGPSGAKAERRVAQLVGVTDLMAVAIGAKFGNLGDLVVPEDHFSPEFLAAVPELTGDTFDTAEDVRAEIEAQVQAELVNDSAGNANDVTVSLDDDDVVRLSLTSHTLSGATETADALNAARDEFDVGTAYTLTLTYDSTALVFTAYPWAACRASKVRPVSGNECSFRSARASCTRFLSSASESRDQTSPSRYSVI